MTAAFERAASKVVEVTLVFWIIKVLLMSLRLFFVSSKTGKRAVDQTIGRPGTRVYFTSGFHAPRKIDRVSRR